MADPSWGGRGGGGGGGWRRGGREQKGHMPHEATASHTLLPENKIKMLMIEKSCKNWYKCELLIR